VRGDSLRDLYAKTLALLGLGLLAAVGALVDYWPVGVGVPQVAALGLPEPERLASRQAVDLEVPLLSAAVVEAVEADALTVAALGVAFGAPEATGRPVQMLQPPLTEPDAARAAATAVTALALPEPALPPGPDFDPAVVYQLGGGEPESGLLSDAVDMVKSTGTTIARGGAITGSSIVGAFRVVSGAFKKLKFF